MKKYLYPVLLLSIAGAFISAVLLLQHYYPDKPMGVLSCGDGLVNPCLMLNQSPFSSLFGIPLAAYGFLFYVIVIFILLIADYAQENFYNHAVAILLPLSFLSVVIDIFLGAVLIASGFFCKLCISTYAINIVIAAVMFLWFRNTVSDDDGSISRLYKDLLGLNKNADRRAFLSSFSIFMFLLILSIFSSAHILKLKTAKPEPKKSDIVKFVQEFYRKSPEKIDFLDKGISLGNPNAKVTIVSFTDFLCSACNAFYKAEKYIFSKYKDKVRVVYFHYPLDAECNDDMDRSMYKNSCVAARAMKAAHDIGILEDYLVKHFSLYKKIYRSYDIHTAMNIFTTVKKKKGSKLTADNFEKLINSEEIVVNIKQNIEIAKKMKINATPTLFIAGRRMVGVPPVEFFNKIIDNELEKAGK